MGSTSRGPESVERKKPTVHQIQIVLHNMSALPGLLT